MFKLKILTLFRITSVYRCFKHTIFTNHCILSHGYTHIYYRSVSMSSYNNKIKHSLLYIYTIVFHKMKTIRILKKKHFVIMNNNLNEILNTKSVRIIIK